MPFNKAVLKKQVEIDEEGYASEVIDVKLVYQIHPKQKYEDVRTQLIQRIDKQFNEMFAAELGLMPERMNEGEEWYQRSMFTDDVISQAVKALHKHGTVLSVSHQDEN